MSHVRASLRSSTAFAVASLFTLAACSDTNTPEVSLAPASPSLGKGTAPAGPTAAPSQYVVLFNEGATGLANPSAANGNQLGKLQYVAGAVYANVTDPEALRADPNVKTVMENTLSYMATPYPTGALYFQRGWQWNMKQIRADLVPATVQGQGTKSCIVDSGIDGTHQDLAGKVVASASFVDVAHGFPGPGLSAAGLDSNGHGTHVAGTVTSNGIGVAAVAPAASLMAAKVFAATGGTPLAAIFDAIAWCTLNNADVINMSIGGVRNKPFSAATLADRAAYTALIDAARNAGTVVVVSAGNDNVNINPGATFEIWPAQIPGTVTVGATAATRNTPAPAAYNFPFPNPAPHVDFDSKASYSQFGADVDIWAPGGTNFINRAEANILSVCSGFRADGGCKGGKYYWGIAGTSMSAPHVTGAVALITSRSTAAKNLARTQAVEACLYASGDPITLPSTPSRPRLNVLNAATISCPGL